MEPGHGGLGEPVSDGDAVAPAASALESAVTGAYVLASPVAEKGSSREDRSGAGGDSSSDSHRSSR